MSIKFYRIKEPHGYMSNFYRSKFYSMGHWWATVEHAYQAAKTMSIEEKDLIRSAKTPREARELGQTVKMRGDFDFIKYNIMKTLVLDKFLQDHDIRAQLLATGDEELIEDSPVDWYWGCGKDGTGQNMLGKVLMEIRSALRND